MAFKYIEDLSDSFTNGVDYEMFKTTCACGHPEHDMIVSVNSPTFDSVEYEPPEIFIEGYLHDEFGDGKFIRICKRIKRSFILLFTGRLTFDSSFSFRSWEHAQEFIKAFETGMNNIDKKFKIDNKIIGERDETKSKN